MAEKSPPHTEDGDEGEGDKPESANNFLKPKNPGASTPNTPGRGSQVDIKLSFAQFHGKPPEAELVNNELISSLQFNRDGNFLAVGDRGGRVTLYKRDTGRIFRTNVNYKPYLTFQSHEPEYDYVKRIEIEEKITQVKWVPRTTSAQHVISSNEKTIKLWRIGERSFNGTENLNVQESNTITSLIFPRVVRGSSKAVSTLRKCYSNAHTYNINTVSVNSDQETFLSADDLRINLWNLEVTDQSFVIVDIKPELMENLSEVITCSTFHPSLCNLFAYGTSRGLTKLCDMRMSALCDRHSKLFQAQDKKRKLNFHGFLSEIVGSISDVQFSNNGRYIGTRDYMKIKIWDTRMENRPLQTMPIHGYLKNNLRTLYQNDSLFDKFTLSWNAQDSKLISGSYHNLFGIAERNTGRSSLFEVAREFGSGTHTKTTALKPKRIMDQYSSGGSGNASTTNNNKKSNKNEKDEIQVDDMDFVSKKVLFSQWHPKQNILALASVNNLYFFSEKKLLI